MCTRMALTETGNATLPLMADEGKIELGTSPWGYVVCAGEEDAASRTESDRKPNILS